MDYDFTMTGTMPLLMHADDVLACDDLMAWRKDPRNKGVSTSGDDRSPPWTWQTYLYHDPSTGELAMPQECLMAALRYAGAKVPSKGKSTFKSMTQSGLLIDSDYCKFTNNGAPVRMADLLKFRNEPFAAHVERTRALGFGLSLKRAKVGMAKHVRVRPRFDAWAVSGTILVSEPAITHDVLRQLFEIAGRLAGLGDWRPSSPSKPGPYGMFSADVRPAGAKRKAS